MVMWGGRRSSRRIGCLRTSDFLRLTSGPNSREASAKQDVIHCEACSVWATRAASSAMRRSLISLSWVLEWAWRCRRWKRLPPIRCLLYTPSSSSRLPVTYIRVMLKSRSQDTTLRHAVSDGKGVLTGHKGV